MGLGYPESLEKGKNPITIYDNWIMRYQMNKKVLFSLVCICLFIFFLNYLNPMAFGDDYVYAFKWPGYPMFTPLPETAERISSIKDIFLSQWLHYFTGNGRTPAHLLVQFFVWQGKHVFNVVNSFVFVLLILEIYWISDRGRVSLKNLHTRTLWGIFISLWAFTPGFNPVFLWICGACNYLWMTVFLLAFLLPYVRKFYFFQAFLRHGHLFDFGMFILGIFAGWSNENSVCWIIMVLAAFLISKRKCHEKESWMYFGLVGLLIGYILMILAPGNMARLHAQSDVNLFNMQSLKNNLYIFSIVLMFQFVLWYFDLKSLYIMPKRAIKNPTDYLQDNLLVKILCVIAFGMSAIMIFAPSFSVRNGFPGTVQLIIATGVLLRVQKENDIALIPVMAQKFMFTAGLVFFLITSSVTLQYSYEMKMQMDMLIDKAQQAHKNTTNDVLIVKPFKDSGALKDFLSGYHLSYYDLSEDENDWGNVAFARYYGIKGIRMVKDNNESKEEKATTIPETTLIESQSR